MRQRHGKLRRTRWQHNVLAIAVASCFAGNVALANPTGPAVAQGQANIATQGNTLTVTNSPGAVINWQGFSIAGNEITRFIQQSQSSSVLNRVVGVNPSTILGTLQSNGRVFLINPNGITVGPGANIDVAGFLASTLNLSDSDFIAGRMRFTETPGAGSVVNEGTITTATGGMVYLVGQDVKNSGIIRSPQGEIMLAAGKSVELVDAQTPEVRVQITAPENQALNVGQLIADGGRIGMYGTLVQNSGVVNANTAVMGENGKIIFKAVKDVTLEAGSVTTANGPDGGSVTAQAETGTLLASGTIEAKGESGKGGTVHLLGNQVGVIGNASVDVSGGSGGGTVLVGGDFQGGNPEVQNAARTFVGQEARIVADATEAGDGGKVVVWADGDTRYYGQITARGGLQSGDGGFVEVSGKEILNFDGRVDVGAPNGRSGTILLDPRDVIIQDTNPGASDGQVSGDSKVLFADTPVNSDYTISDEALEALNGNIVLQARRDITIDSGLSGGLVLTNQTGGERVVLQAGRHIEVNSPLTTNGAALWLEADSPHSNGYPVTSITSGADGAGAVRINAAVKSFDSDPATGGKITLLGGTTSSGGTNGGGFDLNADVNAGFGGIDVALSSQATGQLSFFIGSTGQAQFTSTDTGQLKSTGQLRIGQATTAGSDGLGPLGLGDQITIKVDQLAVGTSAGGPVSLGSDAGTSLVLTSGSGGLLIEKSLSTNQTTSIDTTGALTISAPLTTNGSDLNISAASVSGYENITGTGTITCSGSGCTTEITWDGGGNNLNWFDPLNWSGDSLPTASNDVKLLSSTGTILIAGGTASANSLIAQVPLSIASSGSLSLDEASQLTQGFTLSGSLLGTGPVAVQGSTGVLSWANAGASTSMGSGGSFTIGVGGSGTLSGALTLDRAFHNSGALTLGLAGTGATINGGITGSFNNTGTVNIAGGTSNVIDVALFNNPSNALINVLGSLTVSKFPDNAGQIAVGNGGSFISTDLAGLSNSASSTLVINAGNYSTTGNSVTTDGSGNLAVSGALNAGSITLLAGGSGGVTLNAASSVTATTTNSGSDSIVISGSRFTNSVGPGALNPGAGRFLVWSSNSNPFGGGTPDDRGGLAYNFKQYDAIYGATTVASTTGNGFLYSVAPTITPTLQGTVTKTYDGLIAATLAGGNFATSGIGEIDGDTVVLSNPATGTYASAHAGSGLTVTASSASTLTSATNGGATVYGYQISGSPASGSVGTINAAQLTASASIGGTTSKTYDGLVAASGATVSGSTSGALNGDTVALDASGVNLAYNSAHVASATTISATGNVALGTVTGGGVGAKDGTAGNQVAGQSGDYVLSAQPTIASVAGTINAAQLTASASIGGTTSKTYDGLVAASGATVSGSTSGALNGDTVALDASGVNLAYNSAHVASATTISATGNVALGTVTGGGVGAKDGTAGNQVAGQSGDYVLSAQPTIASVAGTINAAQLTAAAAITGANKTYDGFTVATGSTIAGSASGAVTGDTVTVNASDYTLVFDNPHAGSRTINATGGSVVISGVTSTNVGDGVSAAVAGLAGDYVLNTTTPTVSGVSALINPAVVTLAGSRDYDGSTDFGPGSFGTINGVNGETLTVASGTGTVPSPKVLAGTQSLATGSLALGNGTGLASNYTLVGGTHTGTISATALVPFAWDPSGGDLRWENPANWNQGAVPMNGATASILGGLSGPVVYSSVSGATSLKTLSSASGFTITGGTLTLGNSTADISSFSGAPLTVSGGLLNGPGTINLVGTTLDVLAGGVLGGSRTIVGDVNNLSGTVSPGASPGIMTIDGDYFQGSSATLLAEIGGTATGQYDQLIVTGTVTLGGNLTVVLDNGFFPLAGDTFTIVQGGGAVSGAFASTSLPAALPMRTDQLASSVSVTADPLVNTEQLISTQVNQANNAPPSVDVTQGTSNANIPGGLVVGNTYLETGSGQVVALSQTGTVQSGVYTNVATGQTTILGSGSLPDPGIYLSADGATVLVITLDSETGQPVILTGSTGESGDTVGSQAKVSKPGVCK